MHIIERRNDVSHDSNGKLNAVYQIRIAPEDTKDLETGAYYYDVEYRQENKVFNDTHTLLRCKLIIEERKVQSMNKQKLVGIMHGNGDRQEDLAKAIGISPQRFNAKINGTGVQSSTRVKSRE